MILSATVEFVLLLDTEAQEDKLPDVEEDGILSIVEEFVLLYDPQRRRGVRPHPRRRDGGRIPPYQRRGGGQASALGKSRGARPPPFSLIRHVFIHSFIMHGKISFETRKSTYLSCLRML